MGDQQAKLDKLSWLGGIMDGEGCFHMNLAKRSWNTADGKRSGLFARPMIKVNNTIPDGLETIVGIMKEHNIAHYIWWRKQKKKNWKDSWELSVVGFNSAYRFCELMEPYVVWKAEQLAAMKRFTWLRMNRQNFYHKRGPRPAQLAKYSVEELDCIAKLRGRDKRLHDTDKLLQEAYSNASTTTC